jgi:DNA replication protein DnaC
MEVHSYGGFDEGIKALAERRVVFIDDIGQGTLRGMYPQVLESIIDTRANASLPTFYTSNFSPDELAKRIGVRAASRITRPDCVVHCLKAPDYCRQKGLSKVA